MGSNEIQDILIPLAHGRDLTQGQAEHGFQIIMNGGATPSQIGAFLMGLRQKGETAVEIEAGARVMRLKARPFVAPEGTIDTCGTGGDNRRTLNISTAVAIVAAACGVPVAKHGNRAVTSASGSSDVLEALGVDVRAEPARAERALRECGLAFLMSPLYHKATRHVAEVRIELGLRTIFNLLGPLANPAGAKRQLIGVYAAEWLRPMAEVLCALGSVRAWIVCGEDGMDEITIFGKTQVASLENGEVTEFTLDPTQYGIEPPDALALNGQDAAYNAAAIDALLKGKKGAYRDIVILNAAAALLIAGKTAEIAGGMRLAEEAIDRFAALEKLECLRQAMKHD